MKKKLRIASIALAMITILNLTACEQSKAQNTSTTTTTTTTTTQQTTVIETQNTTTAPSEITTSPITIEQTTTIKPKIVKKTGTTTTTKATVKKNTPKATTKATTTTTTKAQGLTDEDVLWAQQKANEYIASLPKAKLNSNAGGFSSESGLPTRCNTKEKLLSWFKEGINLEYQRCIDYNWNGIELYCDLYKENGNYINRILYTVL